MQLERASSLPTIPCSIVSEHSPDSLMASSGLRLGCEISLRRVPTHLCEKERHLTFRERSQP